MTVHLYQSGERTHEGLKTGAKGVISGVGCSPGGGLLYKCRCQLACV